MTIKKNHHIIPKVYLKEFVDSKPKDFPKDKPFTPFFWKIDKFFKSKPKPKSPKKVFGKNKFYKLADDKNEFQVIEEVLSVFESNYKEVLEKLKKQKPLSFQDIANLILFVESLYQRTENQVEHWQSQFNKLEKMHRDVDQFHNENQNHSDEIFRNSHEIGKKMIITGIGTMGQFLIKEGVYFLYNKSEMSFVSSDNPVLWIFKHIDELQKLNIPNDWLKSEIKNNRKEFFCYFPLSPQIALISSPLLKNLPEQIYQYWETDYVPLVFSMNFLTHICSDSVVISTKISPYGKYEENIKKYLRESNKPIDGKLLLFYTSNSRYWLKVDDYERGVDFPPKIKFWTKDIKTLSMIVADESVEIVHFYEDGKELGYTRNLTFEKVGLSENEPSILAFTT